MERLRIRKNILLLIASFRPTIAFSTNTPIANDTIYITQPLSLMNQKSSNDAPDTNAFNYSTSIYLLDRIKMPSDEQSIAASTDDENHP